LHGLRGIVATRRTISTIEAGSDFVVDGSLLGYAHRAENRCSIAQLPESPRIGLSRNGV